MVTDEGHEAEPAATQVGLQHHGEAGQHQESGDHGVDHPAELLDAPVERRAWYRPCWAKRKGQTGSDQGRHAVTWSSR